MRSFTFCHALRSTVNGYSKALKNFLRYNLKNMAVCCWGVKLFRMSILYKLHDFSYCICCVTYSNKCLNIPNIFPTKSTQVVWYDVFISLFKKRKNINCKYICAFELIGPFASWIDFACGLDSQYVLDYPWLETFSLKAHFPTPLWLNLLPTYH